jgi:acetyl esterase/lipase
LKIRLISLIRGLLFLIIFLLITLFGFKSYSQIIFKRDTSYTLFSTYEKYKKDYPFIKPVIFEKDKGSIQIESFDYITYGERKLFLDVFSKGGGKGKDKGGGIDRGINKPAVILVHGGGWRSGDKVLMHPLAAKLAESGYIAIPVDYRLSTEAEYPAAVNDVNNAVSWVKNHGNELGTDTNHIAILGCSAGGQIASLVGLKYGSYNENGRKVKKRISAIINIDGLMDFTSAEARKYEDDPSKKITSAGAWFGGRYNEKKELWKDASPLFYINKNSPPILFINSSVPRFHAGRDDAIEKLKSYSIYYQLETFNDAPHSFWLFDPWFKRTVNYVIHFLNKEFRTGEK